MHKISPFVFAIILSLIVFYKESAEQLIYIPSSDPIVETIEELQVRGYLGELSQTEKPWFVADVAAAISKDELAFDPLSKKIAEEVLKELLPPQRLEREQLSAGFEGGLGIRALSREKNLGYFYQRQVFVDRGYKNEFGSVYKGGFWMSKESRWGWDTRLIFDSDGIRYPWYYGTVHNRHIIGQFDHAYINFKFDRFGLLFGRNRFVWGPSPRGSILLDDSSPPLDMIGYSFTLKPFYLSGFGARLDDYTEPGSNIVNRRFISGHRLRLSPGKGWEFGFSEIYIYGGPDRLPEMFYSIPIVLYYWEAQNRNLDDNAFWCFDLAWTKPGLGRLYTQINFDDIQRQHRGPQKVAVQYGAYLAPSKLPGWSGIIEFNLVDTYVYGQRKRLNAYLNYGWPLARLDSDQREYFAGIYRRLGSSLKLGAEFVGRDKGWYDASDYQPDMAPLVQKFPSGIVEWTRQGALTAKYYSNFGVKGELAVGYQKVRNFRHWITHTTINQFYGTLSLSYDFSLGLPFWKKYQ